MKQEITTALASLDQNAILCNLPDSEFVTGGAITDACRAAGYDESGRVTVNQLSAWNMTVREFADYITPEAPPTITIYSSESGTRSENVQHSDAASHVAAGGAYSTESEVLLEFIDAEGIPSSLQDGDGDTWILSDKGFTGEEGTSGAVDFYVYQLKR